MILNSQTELVQYFPQMTYWFVLGSLGVLWTCLWCLHGYCQVWKYWVSLESAFKASVVCGMASAWSWKLLEINSQVQVKQLRCFSPWLEGQWQTASISRLEAAEYFAIGAFPCQWLFSTISMKPSDWQSMKIHHNTYNYVIFLMVKIDPV